MAVDIERIKIEIEALKNLNAIDYCKEDVERVYANFEKTREEKIHDLETALAIFNQYQTITEPTEESIPTENI